MLDLEFKECQKNDIKEVVFIINELSCSKSPLSRYTQPVLIFEKYTQLASYLV